MKEIEVNDNLNNLDNQKPVSTRGGRLIFVDQIRGLFLFWIIFTGYLPSRWIKTNGFLKLLFSHSKRPPLEDPWNSTVKKLIFSFDYIKKNSNSKNFN